MSPPRDLPPITAEGKNTFGCRVNGQLWVPYRPCHAFDFSNTTELSFSLHRLNPSAALPVVCNLSALNQAGGNAGFEIHPLSLSRSLISATGNIFDSVSINYWVNGDLEYSQYDQAPGIDAPRYFQVTTLDTVNRVISGIFAFTLYSDTGLNQWDSVVVTDGRFDFQLGDYSKKCSQ